jgi:hypothetical protein
MFMNIKITRDEVKKLVADRLKLSGDFTFDIVDDIRPTATEITNTMLDEMAERLSASSASTGFAPIAPAELLPAKMLPALDAYDWSEVFGEGTGGNCTPIIPSGPPLVTNLNLSTFGRVNVVEILGQEEGENDGADWIVWGKLDDGRYFIARGGCDYTGWDCRASNSGNVAACREDLITFGMSEDERARFKVMLPYDDKSKPVTDRGASRTPRANIVP